MSVPSRLLRGFARTLFAPSVLAAGLVLPAPIALAQAPAREAPAPAPRLAPESPPLAPVLTPGVSDEGGFWNEADRARVSQAVQDLFRRNGCLVVLETYQTLPGASAASVNLSDHAAVDSALNARRDELVQQAAAANPRLAIVMVASLRGGRTSESIWSRTVPLEERQRLLNGIMPRIEGKFGPGMPDALAFAGGFLEGGQPAPAPVSGPQVGQGPGFYDQAGFWSQNDQARFNQTIRTIEQRFPCRVFVETYLKTPSELTRDVNFTDPAVQNRVTSDWATKRGKDLKRGHPGITILVLVCKEINAFRVNVAWQTPGRSWTKQEQELAQSLSNGITQRLGGKLLQGMPDALAFIGDTLQANEGLVTGRSNVAPVTPPAPPQNPAPLPARGSDGNSPADVAAFQRAAQPAGLSDADISALLADRGPASCKDLTDFLNDQVKAGRRGQDLKRDLQTFIRVFKEKVGG